MIVATYGPLDAALARHDWIHRSHEKADVHYFMWRTLDKWIHVVKMAPQATVCADWT